MTEAEGTDGTDGVHDDDHASDRWEGDRDPLADPRVQAGVEHLQRAAREVIAASRALLDAAEDLVDDPRAASTVLEALGSLAARGRSAATDAAARGSTAGGAEPDDGGPVQRIPVS